MTTTVVDCRLCARRDMMKQTCTSLVQCVGGSQFMGLPVVQLYARPSPPPSPTDEQKAAAFDWLMRNVTLSRITLDGMEMHLHGVRAWDKAQFVSYLLHKGGK